MSKKCWKEALGLTSYKFEILCVCFCDDGIFSTADSEGNKVS